MKSRVSLLVSVLLALGLLSWMAGCDGEEPMVTAPTTSVQPGGENPDVPSGQVDKAIPTAADKAWWRGLSQATRNQAIIERAWVDNGRYVGLNCKDWARAVVLAASRNVVNLPSTLPNASGWYFASSPYLRPLGNIRTVFPGCIVQTNWKTSKGVTPHTFIVTATGSAGMNIIESNWVATNYVRERFVSFSTFESQVSLYTCYYVIGG